MGELDRLLGDLDRTGRLPCDGEPRSRQLARLRSDPGEVLSLLKTSPDSPRERLVSEANQCDLASLGRLHPALTIDDKMRQKRSTSAYWIVPPSTGSARNNLSRR